MFAAIWLLTLLMAETDQSGSRVVFRTTLNMAAQTRLDSFDDFNEGSRLVLFYARLAVSESGGSSVTPDHLLLGMLRGTPDVVRRFMNASDSTDVVAQQILAAMDSDARPDKSVEIPISSEAEHVLVIAQGKGRATTSKTVRPEHILLALLETGHTKAVDVLRMHGITEHAVAGFLRQE
jgi:ATP-dependent Clp protease ATP-binding subunit ClpA